MRIRIAAEYRDGVTDHRLFIWTCALARQTEPDRNEPKNRALEDDDQQPRLISTWTFLRVRHQVDCLSQTMLNHSGGSAPTVHDTREPERSMKGCINSTLHRTNTRMIAIVATITSLVVAEGCASLGQLKGIVQPP